MVDDLDKSRELFLSLNVGLSVFSSKLDRNNELLSGMIAREREREKWAEQVIFKEIVVDANDQKQSDPVNNPGFNRARVFLDAGFTPDHTGGLSVSLIYKNSKMSDVMKLISSNGSAGKASEPIDIAHLSGFYFIISNHDSANSTTVKNFRIVLYNEMRA
ncbi:MAG: hypothetical protein FIB08_07615 [Candidatus Methanoperedens sp.]|nr:hypothetical protein [Candidatus Methanoperedens sp.]